MRPVLGIHHVTAIAGDPRGNLEFYGGVLGLRLVKRTVNFDEPGTYHFYFGDHLGSPGTLLTFFPWPSAARGRRGTGQATVVSFSIAERAMGYWIDRLNSRGIAIDGPQQRFDEETITFHDFDGLRLELVANADPRPGWQDGPVPAEQAIRGIHGVTLTEAGQHETAALLVDTLGLRRTKEVGHRMRYEAGDEGAGAVVDVESIPALPPGRVAAGTVHHVAWRTPDDEQQLEWRQEIAGAGLRVTPVVDRVYFHSIYFREPGGVLFEIATDGPGFTIDEPIEQLGTRLTLPPWLESQRQDIEMRLPPLHVPERALGA